MRRFLVLAAVLCAAVVCAQQWTGANGGLAPAAFAQQAQALREVQRSLAALSARLEAIEQQQGALASRLGALERGGDTVSQAELAAVRSDLAAVREAQGRLRGEIVEDITKRLTDLAKKREAEAKQAAKEAAAAQKSGYNHVVEAGQTLSAIAQAYKVSVKSIIQANNIKDPTKVRVGQKLFIPDP